MLSGGGDRWRFVGAEVAFPARSQNDNKICSSWQNGPQNLYQLTPQLCTEEPFKSDWTYPGSRTSSQTPFYLRKQMKGGHAAQWEELQQDHGSGGTNVPTGWHFGIDLSCTEPLQAAQLTKTHHVMCVTMAPVLLGPYSVMDPSCCAAESRNKQGQYCTDYFFIYIYIVKIILSHSPQVVPPLF